MTHTKTLRDIFLYVGLFLLVLAGTANSSLAQEYNPGVDDIYRPNELATIYLTMSDANKAFLLAPENAESDLYLQAAFRFVNSQIDETLSEPIGLRLRGNTSRYHAKKSFKIKFKEFGGSKFHGYKKFNLKADNNDPSLMREQTSLELYRQMNVPAARSSHVKLYINNEYMGVYVNVEQLDDEFMASRFNNDEGNIYKCTWGATLESSNDLYNNTVFELESNEDVNDRSKLAHFVQVLNQSSNSEFATAIQAVFNVPSFIRYLAVEAIIGHWDGYSYNKNNYYLYENPDNGLIELMPYDLDNTLGIDWMDRDWATRDLMDWATHSESRPLVNRILAVEEFRHQYVVELNKLLKNYYNSSEQFPRYAAYISMLSDAVQADTYYPQTYGYSFTDFTSSATTAWGGHVDYGLQPYLSARVAAAQTQLAGLLAQEIPTVQQRVYPNPSSGQYIILQSSTDIPQAPTYVFSTTGQQVNFSAQNSTHELRLDFATNLSPGLYYVQHAQQTYQFVVR